MVIAANAALAAGVVLAAYALPKGSYVVVVTPPWQGGHAMNVIAKAGGSLVSSGRYDWIAVAQSEEQDFTVRLMKHGAVAVLDHALAYGCLKRNS